MSMQLKVRLDSGDTPVNPIWTFGGNTCHAPLLLRDDLRRHLRRVRRELGFRYVRCHGMLSDGMGVVTGPRTYDFSRIDEAVKGLLALGLKPFMELSAMPLSLARHDQSVCQYRFYSSPPRDWDDWADLIRALMRHLRDRFGLAELRQWYFEVWNEPDIAFWTGTQAEYFKLYDLAARAVKETDPSLRVGGPATARTNWIDEFLAHLATPSPDFPLPGPRCDFISTHAYPSDLEFLDSATGSVKLMNSNIMSTLFSAVRRKVDAALGPGFPVICGEWNSSAGPYAFNHDDCNNAAFVVKTAVELSGSCDGSLVWNISDIYEEGGFHHEPFHGGYGLLTVNDLPKAAYHGFALLRRQQGVKGDGAWSRPRPGVGCCVSRRGRDFRVLCWYYREPDAGRLAPVTFTVTGLPASVKRLRLTQVQPGHGSAYETWDQEGRPMFVNSALLAKLARASRPVVEWMRPAAPVTLLPGTVLELSGRCG
jgi:xylan 1,4-beta-xylosidase